MVVSEPMGEPSKQIDIGLILDAQLGDAESVSCLTEHLRDKVYRYLFRLTLNADLADDLTQETLVKMLEVLGTLQMSNTEAFWAWLYRTALGVVQHHYRNQRSRRIQLKTMHSEPTLTGGLKSSQAGGAGTLIRKELAGAVIESVGALKLEYRNVLTLRCLDNLPYARIAAVVGGTELRVRLLFLRAKRCLEKELRHRGVSKAEMLVALATFAGTTAGSSRSAAAASASVKAGSMEVGSAVKILGAVTSIRGIAAIGLVVALVLGAVAVGPGQPQGPYDGLADSGQIPGLWNPVVFAMPSQLVRAVAPNGGPWQGADLAISTSPLLPVEPNMLAEVHRPRPSLGLAMPDEHVVELEFPATISNGPGPDIVLTGRAYNRLPDVSVVDLAGRESRARALSVREDPRGDFIGYDIADEGLSPAATRVRVTGADNEGPYGGFLLTRVRARIGQPNNAPNR